MSSNLILTLLLVPGLAGGAGAGAGNVDPATIAKADAFLKSSDQRLASVSGLRAVYTEVDEYPGEYRDLRQTATVTIAHPNSVRIEIVRARRVKASDPWKDSGNDTLSVSDGKAAYDVFLHPHSTQVRTGNPLAEIKLREAPLLSGFFAGAVSPAAQFESSCDAGKVDQVEVDDSKLTYKAGPIERTIVVGQDGLIHRIEVRDSQTQVTKTWALQSLELNRTYPPSTFAYNPPKGALPYPAMERPVLLENGAQAPDFSDPLESNKRIRLSEFAGKVVVLEFWATWCWPCNQSIPETNRLVTTYHDRGVEGLLVSIKDSRKGFDAWLKKHPQFNQLNFVFDDPVTGQAYEAFQHPQNPTLYVIGRDGRVVGCFQGYAGPNPSVEEAIKSAL